jgi:hypothetical protein
MSKIIQAQDILADARNCVECIFLAASGLGGGLKHDATDPIQVVADTASKKIDAAIAILEDYRGGPNASPVTDEEIDEIIDRAAPDAKPKSPAARTKRRSK